MIPVLKWVGGTLLAAAAAFTLLVPKRADVSDLTDDAQARRTAYVEYLAARDTSRALHQLRTRAEVRATAVALPAVSPLVPLLRIDPRVPADVASRVRDRFADELREASASAPRYPVALVVTVDTVKQNQEFSRAIALPATPGAPCTIVVSVSLVWVQRLGLAGANRFLGACGFYVAFGAPGSEVASWLRATRLASADALFAPRSITSDTSRIDLSARYAFEDGAGIELAACRSGRITACADLLSPDPRALPPLESTRPALWDELADYEPGIRVSSTGSYWVDGSRMGMQSGLLAALARELGSERFGEMWRGPGTLEVSYEAAAGRPLVSWVQEYVAARTLPYRAGPGLAMVAAALAVSLVLLALVVAIRYTPRRVT